MTIFHRAFLYIYRKKSRGLISFILLTVVSVFLLISISVKNKTANDIVNLKESIASSLQLMAPKDKLIPETTQLAELKKIKNIKVVNGGRVLAAFPANFENFTGVVTDKNQDYNQGVTLQGIQDSSLLTNFSLKYYAIVEGRGIQATDKNVVLINDRLAEKNQLTVGERLELASQRENGQKVAAKIVGIYKNIEEKEIDAASNIYLVPNKIFCDMSTTQALMQEDVVNYDSLELIVRDPETINETQQQIEKLAFYQTGMTMHGKTNQYDQVAMPIKSIGNLMNKLVLAIFIVSIGVLSLILNLWLKDRTHEIGILLAVGKGKSLIIGQFILEMFYVSIVAFVVSYVLSGITTQLFLKNFGLNGENQLTLMEIGSVFLGLFLIIVVSLLLASSQILRFKPKEILAKMS